jgi:2-octaprenyl-6-methoxyphenol hydroxylase
MVESNEHAGQKQCKREYDIVVVGASLGGMALILALRDAGYSICVVDTQVNFDENVLTWGHDLQPNALLALEAMGVVEDIKRLGALHKHWYADRLGGGVLARWDYSTLDHSHPYSVCIRAHVIRNFLREQVAKLDFLDIFIPGEFRGYTREGDVNLVTIKTESGEQLVRTKLLVGADGPRSRVREAAGIRAEFSRYSHGWIDTIMSRGSDEVTEGHVVFGRGEYLGIVPTRDEELVTFHLTPAKSMAEYRSFYEDDIERYQRHHTKMAPMLGNCLKSVKSWAQMTWTPALKGRAERWVADGVALGGDAVVVVNPITSQGAGLALEGGVRLATIVKRCFDRGDFSAQALSPYESWSRPEAEAIQEIGDTTAWAFTTRNPLINLLNQRMLRKLETNPKMKLRILASSCGLHWMTEAGLTWRDGLAALGLWPQKRTIISQPASQSVTP